MPARGWIQRDHALDSVDDRMKMLVAARGRDDQHQTLHEGWRVDTPFDTLERSHRRPGDRIQAGQPEAVRHQLMLGANHVADGVTWEVHP